MYRIYCEDVYRYRIEAILLDMVYGYTILPVKGCYNKVTENSLVIELFDTDEKTVTHIAESIREACNQESVAVVKIPATVTFVNRKAEKAEAA